MIATTPKYRIDPAIDQSGRHAKIHAPSAEILQQIKQGNHEAFISLYEDYHARLYSYILKFVKVPAFAEDMLQEVFLKVWESRGKIKPSLSFNAYLYKICRNEAYDFIKEMAADKQMRGTVMHYLTEGSNAVDADLLSKQYERVLQGAVSNLPPQRRNIFNLCRQEGKKYEEVAEMMQISRNTVKDHMVLAVKSIRDYVAKNTDWPISVILLFFMSLSLCNL
jgi:RNA polymerase sigma-70 factor (family 1)